MATGWVCPECAIDYGELDAAGLGDRLRAFPERYRAALSGVDDDALRRRPDATTWSALEYTFHAADVLDDLRTVVTAMAADAAIPTGGLEDPDERAASQRFNERPVAEALAALDAAADATAQSFDGIEESGWSKEADFPWGRRDALTMAQNAVHESHHHLMDVERVLGRP